MGDLRLYAIGLSEVRAVFGATSADADHLRDLARRAFAPQPPAPRRSGLRTLGPLFRRAPDAPVLSPTQPEPHDLDVLLAGGYVAPERTGATWRLLETLVAGLAWGSTRMALNGVALDDLDFALARGGAPASVGLRHLLDSHTGLSLIPVHGLTVGYHPYEVALAMGGAYRAAMPQIESAEQRELTGQLAGWLEGFVPWAQTAAARGRPAPDLLGFWVS
ncbi:MAG: hypothetical protein JWP61_1215 [Friedmanniella sp.]|nr:hypothetical protein [Friedmanniella sp.]